MEPTYSTAEVYHLAYTLAANADSEGIALLHNAVHDEKKRYCIADLTIICYLLKNIRSDILSGNKSPLYPKSK